MVPTGESVKLGFTETSDYGSPQAFVIRSSINTQMLVRIKTGESSYQDMWIEEAIVWQPLTITKQNLSIRHYGK